VTRSFVAVFPPADVAAALDAAVVPVRGVRTGVAWVRAANLHFTMRFLGDLDPGRVEAAGRAVAAAASASSPFAVTTGACGAFPGPARPRVLWIGAGEGAGELVALAARVEAALVREGFARAERPFTPHLTVGRVRAEAGAAGATAAAAFLGSSVPSVRFDVATVVLVASELAPGGSRYTPLVIAPLGAGV